MVEDEMFISRKGVVMHIMASGTRFELDGRHMEVQRQE